MMREKVLNMIRNTDTDNEQWKQAALEMAERLMEQGSPESLMHTLTIHIPKDALHGRHKPHHIEAALNFEAALLRECA